ncbi:hypothetical protein IGI86_002648 [Enterococcus sp. AZ188]
MDKVKVTFAYIWFKGTEQRNPRVRFGEVHVLNNLYTDISSYGIGVEVSAQVIAEENVFINSSYDQDQSGKYQEVPSHGINWSPNDYYLLPSIPVNEVEAYVRVTAGPCAV